MDKLQEEAQRWGIEAGYHDVFGHWHPTPEATLRHILAALSQGCPEPRNFGPVEQHARAYQGEGGRIWGLSVQLYAVRSGRNWGIGDFADLRAIIEIAATAGASSVGLNPLHALFLDEPERASPYSPSSRLFFNPLYIAVDLIDGYRPAVTRQELAALRATGLVDYSAVAKVKLRELRAAYASFRKTASDEEKNSFEDFRENGGESLRRFACFDVLRGQFPDAVWPKWPEHWANPDAVALEKFYADHTAECGFVEFVQWIAHRQLEECRKLAEAKGLAAGLYFDLAVGVDPNGAEAWSHQQAVLKDIAIGAPPDEFNPAGQNWGLTPFNPHILPDGDYALIRRLLAASMRYAGALRLDHVLGLMRLYLIPEQANAAGGAYVRYPFEHLLRVVAEESIKHRCVFIGEDLGTVPEGFRETAARWGVWTYRVMIFERWNGGAFRPVSHYPEEALATFTTHDLPTFRGWMSGHDLALKRQLGLDAGESNESRGDACAALRDAVQPFAGPNGPDHFGAVAGFLSATPSRLVMVQIDDLLGVVDQTNVPGTVDRPPNWRRKLPLALEAWSQQPIFKACVAAFDYSGRGRRR